MAPVPLWPAPSAPCPFPPGGLRCKANKTRGRAAPEQLSPPSLTTKPKDMHQDVSEGRCCLVCPLQQPSAGHAAPGLRATLGAGASPALPLPTSPLPQASTGLLQLMYVPPVLSKPFTTLTPKAKSSLTSAIPLLGAWPSHLGWPRSEGARDLPDPTETLFSPYGGDLGRWLPPTGCRMCAAPAAGAQHEPGQPCPHYGPCSATIAYRRYLFYLICKYRKDVVLFIWSVHLYILF